MPDIFDLGKTKKLIDKQHPSIAIIVDTNIITNEPDFTRWTTSLKNKPLFILPCMVQSELEHLKNKADSKDGACMATQNFSQLCRQGNILEGIFKKEAGWFISTPLPERGLFEAELERLDSIAKVFGKVDTKLIIMAREFSRSLQGIIPIIFVTRDKSLFNMIQFIGINSYLYQGFPLNGIEKLVTINSQDSTRWDKILQDIQTDAEKKLMHVELTLISKSVAPGWAQLENGGGLQEQLVVAEGTGLIHAINDIVFSWSLPFTLWDFPSQGDALPKKLNSCETDDPVEKKAEKLYPQRTYLNFGGRENTISSNLYDALVKKINNCASPMAYIEDMPTVQDPISVMRQFFLFEFVFQERNNGEIPKESVEEFENKLKEEDNLFNWGYYWLRDRDAVKQDVDISLSEFLHAMRSCWSIGETIEIELMDNPAELTNLKGEAEE